QPPNSNLQKSPKLQAQKPTRAFVFRVWNLELFAWALSFSKIGIRPASLLSHQTTCLAPRIAPQSPRARDRSICSPRRGANHTTDCAGRAQEAAVFENVIHADSSAELSAPGRTTGIPGQCRRRLRRRGGGRPTLRHGGR